MSSTTDRTTTPLYRGSATKRLLAKTTRPLFGLLNRPSLRWLGERAYDVALRMNGFAIGFAGKHGLTHPEEAFLQRFLPTAAPGALIDVGANIGSYTRYLHTLRPDLPIYAFEPHPTTFRSLVQATTLPNVELLNMAVTDSTEPVILYDFAANDGSTQASLNREAVALYDRAIVEHHVASTSLDAFAQSRNIDRIAFLKIDTEGLDIAVLRSARALLAARAIAAIQFEIIPANVAARVAVRDFFDELKGYNLFRLCVNGGLWPLEHYDVKRCEVYVVHNIIALRKA